MVEKGIRGGICHAIHRYAKANNKHMKNHDKNKESSYILYLDANSLYGWTKLVCNLSDKNNYVVIKTDIRSWTKVHRVIQFNRETWLKEYIDMNTELRKKRKMILKKTSLS